MLARTNARAPGGAPLAAFAAAALALALSLAGAGEARAQTPIPPFPASGVAVSGVPDTLQGVRDQVARLNDRPGVLPRYTVLLVPFTARGDRPGADADSGRVYTDRVAEVWALQLDPAAHVLVVVSTENRNLTVHTGSRWALLGLEGKGNVDFLQTLEHATYFRAGDWAGGIAHVLERFDAEVLRRVAAKEEADREKAEAAARAAAASQQARRPAAPAHGGGPAGARAPEAPPSQGGGMGAILVLGGLGAVIGGAGIAGARSGARRKAREALAAWDRSFGAVATRIVALEEEHPFVKDRKGLGAKLVGRSKAAFEETGKLLDGLFVAYQEAQARGSEARAALEKDGLLRWKGAVSVLHLLSDAEIDLDGAGGQPPIAAKRVVAFMEQAHHLAKDTCASLQTALLEVRGELDRARERIGALSQDVARIQQRAGATAGYEKARAALGEKADAILALSDTDPIEACDRAKALLGEADALGKRCDEAVHALGTIGITDDRLTGLWARVKTLRAEQGMPLREPGCDPESLEKAAREKLVAARAAIEAACEVKAAEECALAARSVFDLESKVDRSSFAARRGRDEAEAIIVVRDSRRAVLEKRLGELRERSDPGALEKIEAEGKVGLAALERVAPARVKALAELDATRHFGCALALEDAHDALREADLRRQAIDELAKELGKAKKAAAASLATARAELEGALALARTGDGYVPGDAVQRALDEARGTVEAEAKAQAQQRPHWPKRAAEAAGLAGRAVKAKEEAARERASFLAVRQGVAALRAAAPGTAARTAALLATLGAEHAEKDVAPLRAQSVLGGTALLEAGGLADDAERLLGARSYADAAARLAAGEQRLAAAAAIEAALAAAKGTLEAARARALEMVRRGEETVQRVGALLASSTIDREEANRTFREAESLLEDARRIARAGRADWPELAALSQRVERRAQDAEQRARADFKAADAAQHAIGEARAAIASAEQDKGYGERGQTGAARRHLDEAQALLTRREYERALDRAQESGREAARAGAEARSRADARRAAEAAEKRRREDEERRRREEADRRAREAQQAAQAASLAAGNAAIAATMLAPPPPPPPPPPAPPSGGPPPGGGSSFGPGSTSGSVSW